MFQLEIYDKSIKEWSNKPFKHLCLYIGQKNREVFWNSDIFNWTTKPCLTFDYQ
jgi:hypothetical protein